MDEHKQDEATSGPWGELEGAVRELRTLDAEGRNEDARRTAKELLARFEALAAEGAGGTRVGPLGEAILDAAAVAAMRLGLWSEAAARYEAIAAHRAAHGANALDVARARLERVGPLLSGDELDEAQTELAACRTAYEAEDAPPQDLGDLFSYLSLLANRRGRHDEAIAHEKRALAERYAAGLTACALNHYNLASHLMQADPLSADALAHRLAALCIAHRADMLELPAMGAGLGNHLRQFTQQVPPFPKKFAALAAQVGEVPGVELTTLFDALPDGPDGDAVLDELLGRGAPRLKPSEGPMPPSVRDAVHGCFCNLANAKMGGVRATDIDKVIEGMRELVNNVAPGNDATIDTLVSKLQADPAALLAELTPPPDPT